MTKLLSPKLVEFWSEGSERGHTLAHWCPGCKTLHTIPLEKGPQRWSWNGNVHMPFFSPSVNLPGRCHYFLYDGVINFLTDSQHALSGQRVALPDIPQSELDWCLDVPSPAPAVAPYVRSSPTDDFNDLGFTS